MRSFMISILTNNSLKSVQGNKYHNTCNYRHVAYRHIFKINLQEVEKENTM